MAHEVSTMSQSAAPAPPPRARNRDDRSEAASKRRKLIEDAQRNWHFIFAIGNSTMEQCNAGTALHDVVVEHSKRVLEERVRQEVTDAAAMPPPSFLAKPSLAVATIDKPAREMAPSVEKPGFIIKEARKSKIAVDSRKPIVFRPAAKPPTTEPKPVFRPAFKKRR